MKIDRVLSGLMGVCVGDALGVTVEFSSRKERLQSPVTAMQGYGTYYQPPGTWSDDSSLTFCLAEAICQEGVSENLLNEIARNFCRWYDEDEAFWTPRGVLFDIGATTDEAIWSLQQGVSPTQAGSKEERSNGNGSLMRILPLAFCYQLLDFSELIELVHQVSCLTHAHPRSQIACGIYVSIAVALLEDKNPTQAYLEGIRKYLENLTQSDRIDNKLAYALELRHFQRVTNGTIVDLTIDEIESNGYLIDTLEASLWCFLNSSSYADAVLKAVNLGGDTDTTAAVTGGLAGIYYGIANIPSDWLDRIARKDDIVDLANRLEKCLQSLNQSG